MEDPKFKKLLYNEVTFAISMVGIISSFIFWVTNPTTMLSQRVATLEQALEYQTEALDRINIKLDMVDARQVTILETLAALKAQH
jgi:hypothetical protein